MTPHSARHDPGHTEHSGDNAVELPTNLREVALAQCPEKAPSRAVSLSKACSAFSNEEGPGGPETSRRFVARSTVYLQLGGGVGCPDGGDNNGMEWMYFQSSVPASPALEHQ